MKSNLISNGSNYDFALGAVVILSLVEIYTIYKEERKETNYNKSGITGKVCWTNYQRNTDTWQNLLTGNR